MKYRMAGNRVSLQTRRRFAFICLAVLFIVFWCWEPFLGGEIASPLWTVLMVVTVTVFAAGNIWLGRDDMIGAGASPTWYWTKTLIKIILAIAAIILLLVAARNAGAARRQANALPPDEPVISVSDAAAADHDGDSGGIDYDFENNPDDLSAALEDSFG